MPTAAEYARIKERREAWQAFDEQPRPDWMPANPPEGGTSVNSDITPEGEQAATIEKWADVAKRDASAQRMKARAQPKGTRRAAQNAAARLDDLLSRHRDLIAGGRSAADVARVIVHREQCAEQGAEGTPHSVETVRKQVAKIRRDLAGKPSRGDA